MRNKRFLSTVAATALVATTMAMPVMAADGGSVKIEFTTKTPVIRVEVPTTILAAVDPLEMNTPGTQIHSTDFTLINKSEVPIGIDVKSVVTLGTGVTLVNTKAGAMASTGTDAWIGVAAQTAEDQYNATASKTAGDLTDTDKNVATFKTDTTASESSASQTFYLSKGAGADATYKLIAPVASGGTSAEQYKKDITYAQVYELTEVTDDITDDATLLAKLQDSDVYQGDGNTDQTELTLIPLGKKDATFAGGKKYFTPTGTDNKLTSMTDGNKYVYGEGAEGGKTAFRYIGKLGQGKKSWSDTDVKEMNITYSIYGLTDDQYTAANVTSSYGLYKGSYLSASTMTASSNSVTLSLPTGVTLSKVELAQNDESGAKTLTNGSQYTLSGTTFSVSANNISSWLKASPAYNKIKLSFSDGHTEIITLQE